MVCTERLSLLQPSAFPLTQDVKAAAQTAFHAYPILARRRGADASSSTDPCQVGIVIHYRMTVNNLLHRIERGQFQSSQGDCRGTMEKKIT